MTNALFLLAAAFTLYTLFGYPLLLAWLAGQGRPVKKAFAPRRVSVILPVRNGERWVARKLESLLALNYPEELIEILVVSDGSTDATERIVEGYAGQRTVRLLKVPAGGKAPALNRAIEEAKGEILFLTDVRQELSRDSLRNLVACFADPAVGVASGELVIRQGQTADEANVGLYWRYEKWIRMRQSRLDSVIGATGCIYAMRRDLARPLPAETLADDMYLPLAAFFRGYRVILDDSAKAFDDPTGLNVEFRRKVRTLAGVYQMVGFYPALLGPRNRMWLHFVSHKLARLLLPWALLVVAGTSCGLPDPWRAIAWGGQAGIYGLAALDGVLPESSWLKRVTSPTRTFVVLMAASLCAVAVLFVAPRKLWKSR
jgi:cellulose synthase/poly-beta-1,6-N-acetylglucosamine synthase-like glycosyltransferase